MLDVTFPPCPTASRAGRQRQERRLSYLQPGKRRAGVGWRKSGEAARPTPAGNSRLSERLKHNCSGSPGFPSKETGQQNGHLGPSQEGKKAWQGGEPLPGSPCSVLLSADRDSLANPRERGSSSPAPGAAWPAAALPTRGSGRRIAGLTLTPSVWQLVKPSFCP